jgi:hypothetical protein
VCAGRALEGTLCAVSFRDTWTWHCSILNCRWFEIVRDGKDSLVRECGGW